MTTTPTPTLPQSVADAKTLVRTREDEHQEAQRAVTSLEARLMDGDDRVTADDLSHGQNEVRRAGLLLDASRKALVRAIADESKARAMQSPDLAEMLQHVLITNLMPLGLLGVSVEVVDSLPTEAPAADDLPMILLCQTKATQADLRTGVIGGELQMALVYSEKMPLDTMKIRHGLRQAAMDDGIATIDTYNDRPARSLGDGVRMHAVLVTVKNARPPVPVLAEVTAIALKNFAEVIAREIPAAGVMRERGVRVNSGGNASTRYSNVGGTSLGANVTKTRTDADGIVRRTVVVEVAGTSRDMKGADLQTGMDSILRNQVGTFAAGVGRIESLQYIDWEPISNPYTQGRAARVSYVIVSRKPQG